MELTRRQLKIFWWVLTLSAVITSILLTSFFMERRGSEQGYKTGYLDGRQFGQLECQPNTSSQMSDQIITPEKEDLSKSEDINFIGPRQAEEFK